MDFKKHKTRVSISDLLCLCIVLCNALVRACVNEPLVETRSGKLRGYKEAGTDGHEFCAFIGIPYVKTPVGELRFKDPEPVEPWADIRDATNYGPECVQLNYILNKVSGVEDCLYLNVYTKHIDSNARRPVMVWIHPGGFVFGFSDNRAFGAEYFMSKDIVLVTFSYRLNVFGFLNLDDEEAPGNMGLKDQLMALQWVRDNIANFGGDPNDVTIFGESAGGASVHYHALSPLSKGLFHKAIIESGVALNTWAFQPNPKERAIQLCDYLGHSNRDPKSIIQFLKTVDAQTLIKAQKQLFTKEEKMQLNWHFGPSIDLKSNKSFLPIHPEVAAAEGIHVPLIIGHNNREGIVVFRSLSNAYNRFEKEFRQLLHPNVENILTKYDLSFDRLKYIYFKNNSITDQNKEEVVDLIGDLSIVEGTHRTVKIQFEKSSFPTYFYQFTYDKSISLLKVAFQAQLSGAAHTDELFYLFKVHMVEGKVKFPEKGSEQYKISQQLIELWVNFATTGTPTPKPSELVPFQWLPVDNGTIFPVLNICENLRMETMPSLEIKYTTH